MSDMACVIQFPHPGREPRIAPPSKPWAAITEQHSRAFIEARGEALATPDATEVVRGQLRFWGEWEADAEVAAVRAPGREFYVQRPRLQPRTSFDNLHNTDPFAFDGPFLYSNCEQRGVLMQLDRGSLLIFGSTLHGRFVLDTVVVVAKRRLAYLARNAVTQLGPVAPPSFLHAVAQPIQAAARRADPGCTSNEGYVLYEGATPQAPVDGMFTFAPAIGAPGTFVRPEVSVSGLNPASAQSINIRFVYTPRHCSWLNQVEIWFSILARRLLKRASFTSLDNLRARAAAFIEYFNDVLAKPFRWTYTGRPRRA